MSTYFECWNLNTLSRYIDVNTTLMNRNAVSATLSSSISDLLQTGDVILHGNSITIQGQIGWKSSHDLMFYSNENIVLKANAKIISKFGGSVYIKAGIESKGSGGKVIFEGAEPQIIFEHGGKAHIHYNPEISSTVETKYHNPLPYFKHVTPHSAALSYMLINSVEDLQSIIFNLHGNYALSKDVDAYVTKDWNNGKGFSPLSIQGTHPVPFSGNFDGNGFSILNLFVNRTKEDNVGLFGIVAGQKEAPATIKNLKVYNFTVSGRHFVGGLTGDAEYARIENINLSKSIISGTDIVGGIAGTAKDTYFLSMNTTSNTISATEFKGSFLGSAENVIIYDTTNFCHNVGVECVGFSQDLQILSI